MTIQLAAFMPTRQNLELGKIQPLRLFLTLLAVLFAIEAIVMLVLPYLVPAESSVAYGAVIDACILTIVLAPLLWYMIVKPLQTLAATRQRLLAQALSAQEDERRRIARDLHDSLGQSLTGLMVGLRTIEEASSEPAVKEQARELRRIGGDTHDEVRRLARGLRPTILDDLGLLPALERYVEEISTTHQIEATFHPQCSDSLRLSEDVETAIYRIVQEASINAIRHGKAAHLRISLGCDPKCLDIQIKDDGRGFDVVSALRVNNSKNPFGLLSIQERAFLLGGEAAFTSSPGSGTLVRVRIPLSPSEKAYV